jgi:uncharacterized protein (TIGR01319 family)
MFQKNDPNLKVIMATDCGSTTTKAILIEKVGDEYRQTYRGEAPTTVEAPFEDVTKGVLNSIAEIEDLSGRKFLDGENIIYPSSPDGTGCDIYISTSSAGGGLQMMVAGVVLEMTAESAERAALGAGAIVMDALAVNDKRLPHERIERIRALRPDMILLAGGTDGGDVSRVVEMAEQIAAADPRPRLGISYQLPIIFSGNVDARPKIEETLANKFALTITSNIRPTLEQENPWEARAKIQDLFEEHVMAQAPGYNKLIEWCGAPIMPTPAAVGLIIRIIAEKEGINVIGVDIGGATTDVFSYFRVGGEGIYNRSVSANLGMSYSVSNVMAEAGLENVMRWASFDIEEEDLRNRIKNKMIRPTTIPHLLDELIIEQGLAREALRLAFAQHKELAVGLKGIQQQRDIGDVFSQEETGATLIKMMQLDLLVGSGGVLSHAPRRSQGMMMMIDAFQPEGVTRMAVDSIFMMPHLGVLTAVHEQAATEVFNKDCIIYLGTCFAPVGGAKFGDRAFNYKLDLETGETLEGEIAFGEIKLIPYGLNDKGLPLRGTATISPAKKLDMGEGKGKAQKGEIYGGVVGIVLDGRGRPIKFLSDRAERVKQLNSWTRAFNAYPDRKGDAR